MNLHISMMLVTLLTSLLISAGIAFFILKFQHLHAPLTADYDTKGIQKFHTAPVPRIGGIPIACAIAFGYFLFAQQNNQNISNDYIHLMLATSLVFSAGLLEDITKRVGPLTRLLTSFAAAALAYYYTNTQINSMHIPVIDSFLTTHTWSAVLLTMFVVGGTSHAFNIIDGYNGLASGSSIIMLLGLSMTAYYVQETSIVLISLVLAGSVLGFWLFNFPRGKIFLGDGGAYLIGFLVAEMSIMLGNRHPNDVSPWFPMLLVIYPVFETVFSMYRRKRQGRALGLPDRGHLHQLIFLRLVRWKITSNQCKDKTLRNSLTSPYLWLLTTLAVVPAVIFHHSTQILVTFICIFIISYLRLYNMIIHFKTPQWMILSMPHEKKSKPNARDLPFDMKT